MWIVGRHNQIKQSQMCQVIFHVIQLQIGVNYIIVVNTVDNFQAKLV